MRWTRAAVVAVALVLTVGACSDPGDSATTTEQPPTTAPPTPTTAVPLATTLAPLPTSAPTTVVTTTTTIPKVITIWADEATAVALEAIGNDYATRRGVTVEVVERPFTSIRSDVLAAAESGNLPDLLVGAHAWTGELRDAGAVTPIRGISQSQERRFIGSALEGFRLDGALYGLPFAAETVALWINTDVAGTAPPATFEALLDACDDRTTAVGCLAVAGGAGIPEAYYQYPFVTAFGASVLRYEDGIGYTADQAGIDEPEAIAAALFVAALDRGDYLPPVDYVTAKQQFLEGEVAFWLTGAWEADDIATAAESRGFSTAVAPVPPIQGGVARPFVDSFGVFLSATASVDAQIFMRSWLTTDQAMVGLNPAPPLFPAHEAAAARVDDPLRQPFLDAMRLGVPTPNLSEMTDAIWEAWGAALTSIRDEAADPESALTEAATVIRTILGLPQPEPEVDGGEGG